MIGKTPARSAVNSTVFGCPRSTISAMAGRSSLTCSTEVKRTRLPFFSRAVGPSTVSQVDVYWFDDTGRGQVRVPASWRLLYKDGETWKPVSAASDYGVAKDAWNTLRFAPVTTSGLRLEVTLQSEWSAGIQEWRVR